MTTKSTNEKTKQDQQPNTRQRTASGITQRHGNHVLADNHKHMADAYLATGDVRQVTKATGATAATIYRVLKRPDIKAYMAEVEADATLQAGISKADVIARTAEIADIALCRRPLRYDERGDPVYLRTPNLSIAARMVERLGDAAGAWSDGTERDVGQLGSGGVQIGSIVINGNTGGDLPDAMIRRIDPSKVIDHQPTSEDDG